MRLISDFSTICFEGGVVHGGDYTKSERKKVKTLQQMSGGGEAKALVGTYVNFSCGNPKEN